MITECPCEQCIVFAICYQKTVLYCKDLYDFLCYVNVAGFKGYKRKSGKEITRLYKRYVISTQYKRSRIRFTKQEKYKAREIYGDGI